MSTPSLFSELLTYIPQIIVYIVGACIALGMMSHHRRPATLVLVAMGLGLAGTLLWPGYRLASREISTDVLRYWQLLRWISVAISVSVTILLLLAAFANRQERLSGGGFEVSPRGGQRFGGPPTPPPIRTS